MKDILKTVHSNLPNAYKVLICLFVVIGTLAYTSNVEAKEIDCDKHSVYCNIIDKKPNMKPKKAMALSNKVYKYAKKYGQNPHISIAIGMQETGLRNISRMQNVIIYDDSTEEGWKVVRGHSDVCMFQFHVNTIVSHQLDPIRLKDDLDYCIEQHFILMKQKRKICSHLKEDSWSCYHSFNKIPREHYKRLVERYF